MLTGLYARQQGKYTLMKEQLGFWCARAKKGQKMLVCTPLGNFVLRFEGKHKPKTSLIKFEGEE